MLGLPPAFVLSQDQTLKFNPLLINMPKHVNAAFNKNLTHKHIFPIFNQVKPRKKSNRPFYARTATQNSAAHASLQYQLVKEQNTPTALVRGANDVSTPTPVRSQVLQCKTSTLIDIVAKPGNPTESLTESRSVSMVNAAFGRIRAGKMLTPTTVSARCPSSVARHG